MNAKSLWVALPLLAFLALVGLLYSGLGKDPQKLPSALVGKDVPAFSLPSLLTDETFTEQSLHGRWQLINVWATWCPTCHIEHPYLLTLAARGVPIVGINYKDEAGLARDYLANRGNPFVQVISDDSGQLGLDLGVYGAPETFLINPQGKILLRHAGNVDERVWNEEFLPLVPAGQWGKAQ
ncbi:thiol:disulfide interchange protein DsbE [Alcanivorax hongdengensis A-11-3]|uniref:Thiol:disulfide interchange protein DsbE n=1 Tax=Alcanivorax hongdengensis A-11-3 TaxID=1177179 RepID=L0WAE9_9GAMM|nr:DsbE family thiol:disulfide interchange protein [Alcanivorax hongdengensis]EKF73921.1 thiol:disulfide interchange protein DsbE [Alcanivorax hongdengensis A-11-3]